MDLLVTDTRGVVSLIGNNQSTAKEETGFSSPFVIDNRNSTAYYIESRKVFGMHLRNPQSVWVSILYKINTSFVLLTV